MSKVSSLTPLLQSPDDHRSIWSTSLVKGFVALNPGSERNETADGAATQALRHASTALDFNDSSHYITLGRLIKQPPVPILSGPVFHEHCLIKRSHRE